MPHQRQPGFAGDDRARGAAVQHEAGQQAGTEEARVLQQPQHLGRGPAVERRGLGRDQHQVGGQQGRAQQCRYSRWTVDHDVIRPLSQCRSFVMQRVARQPHDTEQPGQPFPRPLRRPVQCRALRVGIDDRHALAFPSPLAREMQRQRRLADAALLVEEGHDHDPSPGLIHGSEGGPTSLKLDSFKLDSKLRVP
ncbi:hypothetical protein MSKU9_2692 [Komagataeibacter diospyri]|uniref:Uncharacterized protein n=1 Tax=Komagataeibacter diospyri TaxID=1932662 RepID=A0A4P5NX45_9PROT|nr:hypothetical protein MSKU9_2692 [Komagataeibacter diospyri]